MAKLNDLINMDYNELVNLSRKENIDDLRSVVKQMEIQAKRRVTTLTKSEVGKYSPALKQYQKALEYDATNKKLQESNETNKLLHQYSNLKNFLSSKTSTLGGWKKVRSNIAKRTGAKKLFSNEFKSTRSAKIWANREARFWKLYNHLVDNYGGIISQLDSNRIQEMLSKVQNMRNQAKTDDDISQAMIVYIDQLYYNRQLDDNSFLDALKTEEDMNEIRLYYESISE